MLLCTPMNSVLPVIKAFRLQIHGILSSNPIFTSKLNPKSYMSQISLGLLFDKCQAKLVLSDKRPDRVNLTACSQLARAFVLLE